MSFLLSGTFVSSHSDTCVHRSVMLYSSPPLEGEKDAEHFESKTSFLLFPFKDILKLFNSVFLCFNMNKITNFTFSDRLLRTADFSAVKEQLI